MNATKEMLEGVGLDRNETRAVLVLIWPTIDSFSVYTSVEPYFPDELINQIDKQREMKEIERDHSEGMAVWSDGE